MGGGTKKLGLGLHTGSKTWGYGVKNCSSEAKVDGERLVGKAVHGNDAGKSRQAVTRRKGLKKKRRNQYRKTGDKDPESYKWVGGM